MSRKLLVSLMLAASLAGGNAMADDPTLHQVYETAQAGRLDDARAMMDQVLKHHPDSGKAHFVEAELLARQGLSRQAAAELATAERLAPGLPFAKPEALRDLRRLVGGSAAPAPAAQIAPAAAPQKGFPWNLLLIGLAVLAFIAVVARRMAPQPAPRPAWSGAGSPAPVPVPASAPTPYAGTPAPASDSGPGLGARVMGGLATGAALGAGMVAGEALAHRFLDRREEPTARTPIADPGALDLGTPVLGNDRDDMGGTDFGISDASSWDDTGSSNDDWN